MVSVGMIHFQGFSFRIAETIVTREGNGSAPPAPYLLGHDCVPYEISIAEYEKMSIRGPQRISTFRPICLLFLPWYTSFMCLFPIITVMILLTAVFGYLNYRTIRLSTTIYAMLVSIVVSSVLPVQEPCPPSFPVRSDT